MIRLSAQCATVRRRRPNVSFDHHLACRSRGPFPAFAVGGSVVEKTLAYSALWRRVEGEWRIVFAHDPATSDPSNHEVSDMCRNIKVLFNFAPPVTEDEIRAAALQFVRKVSGFNKPSKANEAAFLAAVDGIAAVSSTLLGSLETSAAPRYREIEAAKARERSALRFPK
jgi:hypothetical protein